MRRHLPLRTEPALTGSVAVFAAAGVWTELRYATGPQPPAFGGYLLTFGAAACLLVRRERPALAAVGCLLFCLGYRVAGYPGFAPGILIFLACYALGTNRRLAYGLIAAVAGWVIPALPPHSLPLLDFAVSMPPIGMAASAAVGDSARRRRIEHEAQIRQSAATAEAQLGRRLAEERLRIARELHDVLAHTISVVAVQSGVALDVLDENPEQAREALLAVRGAAKQAMPELRAALDLLRGGGAGGGGSGGAGGGSGGGASGEGSGASGGNTADLRPQPDLSRLPELAAQLRDSGLSVDLDVGSDAGSASSLIQLTAYRIVQESLTNVLRHSPAASATARITTSPDALVVEVVDDGTRREAEQRPIRRDRENLSLTTPGFGLVGMRERAEALGGEFHAAPRPEGGFRVLARLPWEAAP